MNTTPPLAPAATRRPDLPWWPTPALFTALAVLGGAWGYHSSPILHGSVWLVLPYAVPLALVAAAWWPPSRPGARARGLALGVVGALAALTYAHLATFTLYTVALVLWAFQGGG
ncbi:hypothetical protein WKI68_42965 [Streptomyces sp. MS1.HAVA.3]|uniref:Apolipoprotein N-acyltransferase n=1 Tax=Streptomyces caledonius TaxID=3134107 RepID=A0ABU8UEV1_9ACTN